MKRDYVYIRYECGHVLAVPKAKAEIYAVGQYAVCNICAEVTLVKEILNANVAKKKGAIERKSSAMYRRQAINIEIIGLMADGEYQRALDLAIQRGPAALQEQARKMLEHVGQFEKPKEIDETTQE